MFIKPPQKKHSAKIHVHALSQWDSTVPAVKNVKYIQIRGGFFTHAVMLFLLVVRKLRFLCWDGHAQVQPGVLSTGRTFRSDS